MTSLVEDNGVAQGDFNFLQSLAVHSAAVRCLTVLDGTDDLISGSMDTSAKMFVLDKEKEQVFYAFDKEFTFHEGFILAVHKNVAGQGFYTASKDTRIMHIDA